MLASLTRSPVVRDVISSAKGRPSLHLFSLSQLYQHPSCFERSRAQAALRFYASSSSSTRWRTRQSNDSFTREAKIAGLKSRAAFKLLQINERYHIFKRGITVVDLGYAPGSWSQVAVNRCAPNGRVVGVDIIPAQPPAGVSTIQGDFLSPAIQEEVRAFVADPNRGRPKKRRSFTEQLEDLSVDDTEYEEKGYIDMGRQTSETQHEHTPTPKDGTSTEEDIESPPKEAWTVDVVLSDMSTPWEPASGHGKRSLIDPYRRLMSTSGMPFRDHAGSMDLCTAALLFAFDTLKEDGHFVCKFYQGAEDKELETRLRRLFAKVHREKPAASRSESKEGYFVGLRRKVSPTMEEVFAAA